MKHQVIVADDSQTIQKVIAITLSSEPYELTDCLDVKNLISLVKEKQPSLVLLDFNLSDDKTGYDLCKDIKNESPNTNVVYLFGTFDTIDEELITESGASNWIVKPFDGNKFINLCRALTESGIQDLEEDEVVEESSPDDEWVMDVPNKIGEEPEEIESHTEEVQTKNALESSMEDWGIEVPGIIGESSSETMEIPGVISASDEETENNIKNENLDVNESEVDVENQTTNEVYPESEDLEYPDSNDLEYPEIIEPEQKPTVELIPLDELKAPEYHEPVEENQLFSAKSETDIESLKEQIEDEQDDLWSLDDEEDDNISDQAQESDVIELRQTPSDFPKDVMTEEIEEKNDLTSTLNDTNIEVQEQSTKHSQSIDTDELISRLRPMIEEIVKAECQKIAEKVSWEVIPDLAENLIKTEIENISKQVLDQ